MEKKIGRARIEPVSQQNKFDSGRFSALSTFANKAVVRDWCIIVTWSFRKRKGFFCFLFNNRCRLENWGLFCIRYFSKMKGKTAKKNTGWCVSIQVETTCKVSGTFAKKKKNTSDRHLAWFCTQPFNYFCLGRILEIKETTKNFIKYGKRNLFV